MWTASLARAVMFAAVAAVCFGGGRAARAQEPARAPSEQPASQSIVEVRVVNQQGRVLSENPKGLPLSLGKPVDAESVRTSLRQLYRTGDYADLRAETAPAAGGVRLDFVVRENLFINQVRLHGLVEPPSAGLALASLRLNLGDPFRTPELAEAAGRLQDTLRDDGFYQARVTPSLSPQPETHQMDILLEIAPGSRARAGAIRLSNGTEYSDARLLSRFKLHAGSEITAKRISDGAERIRKFLVKKGHLSARAVVHRGVYNAASNSVPLELDVSEGPKVRVQVTGARVSSGELRKLLPIYQEGTVDADLLEEGRRNLRDRLESQSYFDARVDVETSEKPGNLPGEQNVNGFKPSEQVITYRVERGDRHRLLRIEINGNHFFSDALLRGRLRIQPGAFAVRGRFSRRLLQSDTTAMHDLYLTNGFQQAHVSSEVLDNYRGKVGDLVFRFTIEEGPQTRVASLALDGNRAFTNDELLGVIGSTPGQAYSAFGVSSDRDNIMAMYFNEGFPEAHFNATVEETPPAVSPAGEHAGAGSPVPPAAEAQSVRLTYHIEEGPQILIHRILIGGQERTRPGVIRRAVRLRAGEPLRQGDAVESQRQLYNLGVFNRVTVAPQNPDGSDPEKNAVVMVEEGKRYTLGYGGGFEVQRLGSSTDPTGGTFRFSPRGIFELTEANITGRADTLALKIRGSTLQGRAALTYASPDTFGDPKLSFQATAYAEKTRDVSTFTADRVEGSIQLADTVSPLTTLFLRYSFRDVRVSDLQIPAQEVPLFNQPTLVSMFGVTYFRDRRDNPADPARGNYNNVDVGVAGARIGSSASFLRFFFQNSTYTTLGRRFTFARSARFGILEPYGATVSLSFPPPTTPPLPVVIPLPERFFAGGGTSLRGFALNQAGPRDPTTGFPIGGQALLVLNQELRFPMRLPFIGTRLGGAMFYDGGNVYSRLTHMTFRLSPPKPIFDPLNPGQCLSNCTNELDYFSHTIGFGVRYATPVGPVRVDFGYLVNRATFLVPCTPGVPNCQQAAQLPRFQVFFNLGSMF
jgi:outer membrane protein insertion porin family